MPPIGPILALLGKFWPFIGIGVLVLIVGVQTARLNHAKHDLANARAALIDQTTHRTWRSEAELFSKQITADGVTITNLDGAIAQQNASITAMKAQADARAASAARAVQNARAATQAAQGRIQAILAAKPTSGDACQDADSLILGSLK